VGVLEYCAKSEKHPRSGLEMLKARLKWARNRLATGLEISPIPILPRLQR
jgi:hypothetical protein